MSSVYDGIYGGAVHTYSSASVGTWSTYTNLDRMLSADTGPGDGELADGVLLARI